MEKCLFTMQCNFKDNNECTFIGPCSFRKGKMDNVKNASNQTEFDEIRKHTKKWFEK